MDDTGPRFLQPAAPRRHGTSHPPATAEPPGDRLQAVTKLLHRVLRRRPTGGISSQQLAAAVKSEMHRQSVHDRGAVPHVVDFQRPVSREARERVSHLEPNRNHTFYFEAIINGEDTRRRTERPGYRVKTATFFARQTTREQRALSSRSMTLAERAALKGVAPQSAEPEAVEATAAPPSEIAPTATAPPPKGDPLNPPIPRQERPQSAPAVRGFSIEKSVHSTVSKATKAAQDEAVLWGASAESQHHSSWTPYTLGAYCDADRVGVVPSHVPTPFFDHMANHEGYTSTKIARHRRELAAAEALDLQDPTGSQPRSEKPTPVSSSGTRRFGVSIPDFSKGTGKDAPVVGHTAPGSTRVVDFALGVSGGGPGERPPHGIDWARSESRRSEPRPIPYCSHMLLFPKYSVVDIAVKSPRLPPRPRLRPASAPINRPSAAQSPTSLSSTKEVGRREQGSNRSAHAVPGVQQYPPALAGAPLDDMCHPRIVRNVYFVAAGPAGQPKANRARDEFDTDNAASDV